jgi:DNA-directed RNA polymerase delta subunit
MAIITFKPKHVTKRLTSVLGDRPRFVIMNRFGLGDNPSRMTLEAIGSTYGITRERVRQIENFGLNAIRRSEIFEKERAAFEEMERLVAELGGVVAEEDLLSHVSNDPMIQNHVHLLLVLGDSFVKEKENKEFKSRWMVDQQVSKKVHESLRKLSKTISKDDLIPEGEMVTQFLNHLDDIAESYRNEEIIRRWLSLSKALGRNPLGEWGSAESSNINARGIRDYAFLVIRQHGSPMHFTEVAKAITEVFGKKAHTATCHNELIKDGRFVLVGRGLYALTEWGYQTGVVKDVIKNVLKKHGSLTRDEIVEQVLKERYVKENTVAVNLQDSELFKRDNQGRYSLA